MNFDIIRPMNTSIWKLTALLLINIGMFATASQDSEYSAEQKQNIIARTLFMEARSEYRNEGLKAVASVIYNRAGGDTNRFVAVCFEKGQFAVWNKYSPLESSDYTAENYRVQVPWQAQQNKIEMKAWLECDKWAKQMVDGEFESNIGNRNMYDTEATGALRPWWERMTDKKTIGPHTFGYLPERDGFKAKNG